MLLCYFKILISNCFVLYQNIIDFGVGGWGQGFFWVIKLVLKFMILAAQPCKHAKKTTELYIYFFWLHHAACRIFSDQDQIHVPSTRCVRLKSTGLPEKSWTTHFKRLDFVECKFYLNKAIEHTNVFDFYLFICILHPCQTHQSVL